MAGGGSGPRGGEVLRTKMKEADSPGPGNRLDGGLRAEWWGRVQHGALVSGWDACMCAETLPQDGRHRVGGGEVTLGGKGL